MSTTGRWRCDKLPIIYDGESCWGVVFSEAAAKLDGLALRSNGSPYDLMETYGDADEGMVVKFSKVRMGR